MAAISQVARLDLARRARRAEALEAKLSQLSPLRILGRGYAIVTNESVAIVKDSQAAPVRTAVHIRLAQGSLDARVIGN